MIETMKINVFDKVGSVGAVVAGAAIPCCFPFLSVFGSIVGIGLLARYESILLYVMQGLVVVALIGTAIAYRTHRKIAPLIVGILSTAAVIYAVNTDLDTNFIYGGMVGLLVVAVWNSIEAKRCKTQC